MPTRVILESPIGTVVNSRSFDKGQSVRIGGKVTSSLSFPVQGSNVTIQIYGPTFAPLYYTDTSNFLGDFWVDTNLPFVDSKATIEVVAPFPVGSPDQVIIPIAIGNAQPDPLPLPDDGWTGLINKLLIGGLIIAIVYIIANKKVKE